MWLRLKIAFRNTFRNKRRTSLNVLMIAGGVSAMIVFQGFCHRVVTGFRETTINTQTGHLQIATQAYWNKTARSPRSALIHNYDKILKDIRKNKGITYASGRLSFFGLLTNGDLSRSAQGISYDPVAEKARANAYKFVKGRNLKKNKPFEIGIGKGLAKNLRLKVGDRATILVHTYEGAVNAIDVEVCGHFETSNSAFDDNSFIISLGTAQSLLDTTAVEQIVVGLKDTEKTEPILASLDRKLRGKHPNVRVRGWFQIAQLYNQIAEFSQFQNRTFQLIILALVLLSIVNTVGMSIFERTGEIGTIRALGETSRGVLSQFLLEGAVLGCLGAVCGILGGAIIAQIVNWSGVTMMLPGTNSLYLIEIKVLSESVRDGVILAVVTSIAASFLPSLRASKMNVVEALRRNFQ